MFASVLPESTKRQKGGFASAIARERSKCRHACSNTLAISHHLATYGHVAMEIRVSFASRLLRLTALFITAKRVLMREEWWTERAMIDWIRIGQANGYLEIRFPERGAMAVAPLKTRNR
jgi:hypothetical protein